MGAIGFRGGEVSGVGEFVKGRKRSGQCAKCRLDLPLPTHLLIIVELEDRLNQLIYLSSSRSEASPAASISSIKRSKAPSTSAMTSSESS